MWIKLNTLILSIVYYLFLCGSITCEVSKIAILQIKKEQLIEDFNSYVEENILSILLWLESTLNNIFIIIKFS